MTLQRTLYFLLPIALLCTELLATESDYGKIRGWLLIDPDDDCEFKITAEKIEIAVPATPHGLSVELNKMNAPRVIQLMKDDFAIQVRVAGTFQPQQPTIETRTAYLGAGLLLMHDDENYIRLERAALRRGDQVNHYVNFEQRRDGKLLRFGVPADFPMLADDKLQLKLCVHGKSVAGYARLNEADWKSMGEKHFEAAGELSAGIVAINATNLSLTAIFQDLQLTSQSAEIQRSPSAQELLPKADGKVVKAMKVKPSTDRIQDSRIPKQRENNSAEKLTGQITESLQNEIDLLLSDKLKKLLRENDADEAIMLLKKERARTALFELVKSQVASRYTTNFSSLLESTRRVTSALLALATDPVDHLVIFEQAFKFAAQNEEILKQMCNEGRADIWWTIEAKFDRLSIEIRLAEWKMKLQPKNDETTSLESQHLQGVKPADDRVSIDIKPQVIKSLEDHEPLFTSNEVKKLYEKTEADGRLNSLKKERARAALWELGARQRNATSAEIDIRRVVGAERRVISALLALEPDPATHLAILERALQYAEELERAVEARNRAFGGNLGGLFHARYDRMSADILIEEWKTCLEIGNSETSRKKPRILPDIKQGVNEFDGDSNLKITKPLQDILDFFASETVTRLLERNDIDSQLISLKKGRVKTALLELDSRSKSSSSDFLSNVESTRRVTSALLALKPEPTITLAMLEISLELEKENERVQALFFETGTGTIWSVIQSKYERLTSEILLREEETSLQTEDRLPSN